MTTAHLAAAAAADDDDDDDDVCDNELISIDAVNHSSFTVSSHCVSFSRLCLHVTVYFHIY